MGRLGTGRRPNESVLRLSGYVGIHYAEMASAVWQAAETDAVCIGPLSPFGILSWLAPLASTKFDHVAGPFIQF